MSCRIWQCVVVSCHNWYIIIIWQDVDNKSGCATPIIGFNSAIFRSAACMHGMFCLSCFLFYSAFFRQLQPRLLSVNWLSEFCLPTRSQYSGIMGLTTMILVFSVEFPFTIRHDTMYLPLLFFYAWHWYTTLTYMAHIYKTCISDTTGNAWSEMPCWWQWKLQPMLQCLIIDGAMDTILHICNAYISPLVWHPWFLTSWLIDIVWFLLSRIDWS